MSGMKYKGETKGNARRNKGGHWGQRGRHIGRGNGRRNEEKMRGRELRIITRALHSFLFFSSYPSSCIFFPSLFFSFDVLIYFDAFFCARFWMLDPINGTKGFLCGGQYTVCLMLLVNACIELGVIGCPNLPTEPYLLPQNTTATDDNDEQKCAQGQAALFITIHRQGAYQLPLYPPTSTSGVVQPSAL